MKQKILLLIAFFIGTNCFAITNKKPVEPVVFSVKLSKEKAWQKVLDLFIANSIPIKLMDKTSGLIQSEKVGLGTHYALKGMSDGSSWALCEAVPNGESDGYFLFPKTINADLQVYIREVDAENALLSVNLLNLYAETSDSYGDNHREFKVETSKILENTIGEFVNTNAKMPSLNFDPPLATFGELPSQLKKRKEAQKKQDIDTEKNNKAFLGVLLGIIIIGAIFLFTGKIK